MLSIVAPKTTGPMPVSNVDRICVPIDMHIREHGPIVNTGRYFNGTIDIGAPLVEHLRIFRLVGADHRLANGSMSGVATGMAGHHSLDNELFDPGQRGRDLALEQRLVDPSIRRRKSVRGSIVAIHAIH